MKTTNKANLIDCLASSHRTKRELERQIAQLALGVVTALQNSEMTLEQAWADLFNLDNFLAIRRRRLGAKLVELFDWGMQLEDVAELARGELNAAYAKMTGLARYVIRSSLLGTGRPARSSTRLRRSA
jgi:hypothetical protein